MVFKCRRELVEKDFDPKMLANQCDKNEFLAERRTETELGCHIWPITTSVNSKMNQSELRA